MQRRPRATWLGRWCWFRGQCTPLADLASGHKVMIATGDIHCSDHCSRGGHNGNSRQQSKARRCNTASQQARAWQAQPRRPGTLPSPCKAVMHPTPSLPAHDVTGLLHCGPACQSVAALAVACAGCSAAVVPGLPRNRGWPGKAPWHQGHSHGGHAPEHQPGIWGPCEAGGRARC